MGRETDKAAAAPISPNGAPQPSCVETYSPERIAEFLLNNAVTPEDYEAALEDVRNMGLDPAKIAHQKPAGA